MVSLLSKIRLLDPNLMKENSNVFTLLGFYLKKIYHVFYSFAKFWTSETESFFLIFFLTI